MIVFLFAYIIILCRGLRLEGHEGTCPRGWLLAMRSAAEPPVLNVRRQAVQLPLDTPLAYGRLATVEGTKDKRRQCTVVANTPFLVSFLVSFHNLVFLRHFMMISIFFTQHRGDSAVFYQ